MGEEKDWLYEDDDVMEAIRRYEDMMKRKTTYFFDVHEFEEIINYYIDINNFGKAVAAAEYGYRLHPSSIVIQLKIAHLLIDRGKASESISLLNNIEKLEQSNYEVYILKGTAYNILGNVAEAKKHFDIAVALTSENKSEVLCNIGITFEDRAQFNTAIGYFLESYDINKSNIAILYDLAYCYDKINDYEKSIYYYEKYLDEDPYSDNAWFNLGIVYNSVKEFDKALRAFDFTIAINENYGSAYYNKANILSELERYSEAIQDYMEFLKLEENHVMTHCYIGECYEKLHRYEEALYYFQTALAYDPDCADAWFGTGIVKMHQNLYEESIQNLERALSLNEDCTEYLFALGLIYMRQNDSENSLRFFKQVTDLDQTDFDAWLNYSEILLNIGNLSEAIEVLQKGLDYNYDNAYLNLRMASYLFLSRKITPGLQYLEKALAIDTECIAELYEFYPESLKNITIMKVINKYVVKNNS